MKIQPLPIPTGREGMSSSDKAGASGSGGAFAGTLAEMFQGKAGNADARSNRNADDKEAGRDSGRADNPSVKGEAGTPKGAPKTEADKAEGSAGETPADAEAEMAKGTDGPNAEARFQWLFGNGWHKGHSANWEAAGMQATAGGKSEADATTGLSVSGEATAGDVELSDDALAVANVKVGSGKATPAEPGEGAAPRVRLDVLHMETHFEPVSGQAVLVEGEASPRLGARGGTLEAALSALLQKRPAGEANSEDRPSEGWDPRGEAAASRLESARGTERGRLPDVAIRSAAERAASQPNAQNAGNGAGSAGLPFSLAGQVADRIVEAFTPETRALGAGADQTSNEAHLRMRAGGAALKTLTLRLQPETLGILHVSMRLVDGELTLELAASQSETAKMLTEDKANLRTVLEKAGFNLDDAAIRVVARDLTVSGTARGAEGGAPGQSGAGTGGDAGGRQAGPNGQNGEQARGQGGHNPQERGSSEQGRQPDPASIRPGRTASGSVYL